MTRRSRTWIVAVAAVFALGNLAGVFPAASAGEAAHATTHVALMLVGAYVVWRLLVRPARQRGGAAAVIDQSPASAPRAIADRLARLQQSLGAMEAEVERIGEGQRFLTRLYAERRARGDAAASGKAESERGDS